MARSGTTIGTIVRWDDAKHSGLIEAPDLPVPCWVDASVVDHEHVDRELRAGQVVEVDRIDPEQGDAPLSATRVVHRGRTCRPASVGRSRPPVRLSAHLAGVAQW